MIVFVDIDNISYVLVGISLFEIAIEQTDSFVNQFIDLSIILFSVSSPNDKTSPIDNRYNNPSIPQLK
jgi:hypothetical protein